MLTDSQKLDKIIENQELIIKSCDTNNAILNVFLDMSLGFLSHSTKRNFDQTKAEAIKRVEEYRILISEKRQKSESDNPDKKAEE